MGTQATLGAVYWHDVDPVVDYQLMVGGPPLWDLNSGCGRRTYSSGYCDLDATRTCSSNADCASLSARSQCTIPGPIALAWLYEQMANHVHATQACDVSAGNTGIHAPFDESGFAFVTGDWDFDHPIDFQMDIWGSDGDRRWGMGDSMQVFNSITSAAGHQKRWNTTTDSGHCDAIGDGRALQLVTSGMNLGNDPPPPPPPPPPPNRPPEAVGAFADLNLSLAEQSDVQLRGKFRDEGSLRYRVESSAPSVASAPVVEGMVRVTGRSPGAATITVTATDGGGLSAWRIGHKGDIVPETIPGKSVEEMLSRIAELPNGAIEHCLAFGDDTGGHPTYVLHCDRGGISLAFDADSGSWHCRSSVRDAALSEAERIWPWLGLDQGAQRVTNSTTWRQRLVFGGYTTGENGVVSHSSPTDWRDIDQGSVLRVRQFGAMGTERRRVRFPVLRIDAAYGLAGGDGDVDAIDPRFTLLGSDDGGKSFVRVDTRRLGPSGGRPPAPFYRLGSGRQRVYRLECSSSVPFTILGAYMDSPTGRVSRKV